MKPYHQYNTTDDPCAENNGLQGDFTIRISSVFVILIGSLVGAILPIILNPNKKKEPSKTENPSNKDTKRLLIKKGFFFAVKYIGSGVIIATAFIHLLSPAEKALNSTCLKGHPIRDYDFASGIVLMTIFVMFFIELIIARSASMKETKQQDVEAAEGSSPVAGLGRISSPSGEANGPKTSATFESVAVEVGSEKDNSGHNKGSVYAKLTSLFILEFGVIFHSVLVGLTLALTGDEEFTILYIVLAFHQTFEGLGLGTRLAEMPWPKSKSYLPWALATIYGLTTPVAIGAGLGVRAKLPVDSTKMKIVSGCFDAISAGVLTYTGLVELMAHEFMFDAEMRKASLKKIMTAFLFMCFGAGVMAFLGKWA